MLHPMTSNMRHLSRKEKTFVSQLDSRRIAVMQKRKNSRGQKSSGDYKQIRQFEHRKKQIGFLANLFPFASEGAKSIARSKSLTLIYLIGLNFQSSQE